MDTYPIIERVSELASWLERLAHFGALNVFNVDWLKPWKRSSMFPSKFISPELPYSLPQTMFELKEILHHCSVTRGGPSDEHVLSFEKGIPHLTLPRSQKSICVARIYLPISVAVVALLVPLFVLCLWLLLDLIVSSSWLSWSLLTRSSIQVYYLTIRKLFYLFSLLI